VLSASVLAAMRGDAQIFGRGGLGTALIVLVMFGLLGFGIYRFRFRPRTEASEMDASSLRLRHSSKDRFSLRDVPFAMLDRLAEGHRNLGSRRDQVLLRFARPAPPRRARWGSGLSIGRDTCFMNIVGRDRTPWLMSGRRRGDPLRIRLFGP